MAVVTVLALLAALFWVAWHFEDTLIGVLPYGMLALGFLLYALGFLGALGAVDFVLLALGLGAGCGLALRVRREGAKALFVELRRQLLDPHLWVCAGMLVIMCLLLRGEKLLEWDAYNFWGPDTKSLFFRGGYAPVGSNAAPRFGDYPPFCQLIFWWVCHLTRTYNEQYLYFGYYILGALMLYSVAVRFESPGKVGRWVTAILAGLMAVMLPGVVTVAWFRSIYVDSILAMVFGAALVLIVCGPKEKPALWSIKIGLCVAALTLIKSVGILWAALALVFLELWRHKEKGLRPLGLACAGGAGLAYGSWKIFCAAMGRTTYLSDSFSGRLGDRVSDVQGAGLLAGENTRPLLSAFGKALTVTPVHGQNTWAVDFSILGFVVIFFVAAWALGRWGFYPREKRRRLMVFMGLCLGIGYLVVLVGQMTMFYYETQYFEPANAVMMLARYCAPAHVGLLMLLCALASGRTEGAAVKRPSRKAAVAAALAGAVIFLSSAYVEMGWRFISDPLDDARVQWRSTYEQRFEGFFAAIAAIPLDAPRSRVLLGIHKISMNPIVINAAAPVGFVHVDLSGENDADADLLLARMAEGAEGYVFLHSGGEGLAEALSGRLGQTVEFGVLYRIEAGGTLSEVRP